MSKITTQEQLMDAFPSDVTEEARVNLQCQGVYGYEPFGWHVREQCRMDTGIYKQIKIDGDDVTRFLHVSVNDPTKVAYTNDEHDGERDVQRTTTLPQYCEKFGLAAPVALTPEVKMPPNEPGWQDKCLAMQKAGVVFQRFDVTNKLWRPPQEWSFDSSHDGYRIASGYAEESNSPAKDASATALVKRYIAALNEVRLLEAELRAIF